MGVPTQKKKKKTPAPGLHSFFYYLPACGALCGCSAGGPQKGLATRLSCCKATSRTRMMSGGAWATPSRSPGPRSATPTRVKPFSTRRRRNFFFPGIIVIYVCSSFVSLYDCVQSSPQKIKNKNKNKKNMPYTYHTGDKTDTPPPDELHSRRFFLS